MKRLALLLVSLGLLAGAAVPPQPPTRSDAQARLTELAWEVVQFRDETGALPSSFDGLAEVASSARLLADPWGNEVFYLRVAGGFWLMSWGADGAPGGDGDAADVVYIAR